MMKKITYAFLLVAILLLSAGTVALAIPPQPFVHGDFQVDSTGCAQCHITHAGTASHLLVGGSTQTDVCNFCHSDVAKSPYNTNQGKMKLNGSYVASFAGGFLETFNFAQKNYNLDADASDDANYNANSSIHGVEPGTWALMDAVWLSTDGLIPGGSVSIPTGNFRCGSCHDPHGGGDYTAGNGTIMPRLLRRDLPSWGAPVAVTTYDDWTLTAWVYSNGANDGYRAMRVTGYGDSAGLWCAGCHDVFNQMAHNAGAALVNGIGGVSNKYMHRMNFDMTQAVPQNGTIDKVALSTGGFLTCLTCHRAHGTDIAVTGTPNFGRAAATYRGGAQTNSTVLLREKNRDVCYDCHLGATNNTPLLQGP